MNKNRPKISSLNLLNFCMWQELEDEEEYEASQEDASSQQKGDTYRIKKNGFLFACLSTRRNVL